MTKLDELIKEYCPNGVEYKTIGDCTLKTTNIRWKQENRSFRYIDLTSVDRDTHRIVETTFVNKDTAPSRAQQIVQTDDVLFGGTRPMLKRYCLVPEEYNGQVCSTGFCVLRPNNNIILTNWLYHHISSSAFYSHVEMFQKGASYPAITDAEVKMFKIPVPPLPVQEEIVRILDNFTVLTAELTAELTARKEQYHYYLNHLFNIPNDGTIEFKSVGELFEIKNGLNKEKSAFGKGKPIINFTDVYNNRWLSAGSFKGLVDVTDDEIERYSAQKGDVFFTRTSETKEDIGMSSTLIDDVSGCVFSGFVLRARPITNLLLPKFCAYFFSTDNVRKDIVRYAAFTTRATTTGPKLSKIMVPILPLDEQERIVSILDRFDTLCNDITAGLPAEIEARQKQYEYYRDKLLTFKELER